MTDIIYYASSGSTAIGGGVSVVNQSMWYQECPGAPLFALSGGLPYLQSAGMHEFSAFAASREFSGSNAQSGRFATTTAIIASIIALRGTTTKPIGNF